MSKTRILTHEERLAMTRKTSGLLQEVRNEKNLPTAYPRAEEVNEKILDDENSCPYCGGELVRFEGCYRCKNCGYSKCG